MTQAEKFMTLINSTPGVVSDRILKANGVSSPYAAAYYSGVKAVRVSGLGYRKQNNG